MTYDLLLMRTAPVVRAHVLARHVRSECGARGVLAREIRTRSAPSERAPRADRLVVRERPVTRDGDRRCERAGRQGRRSAIGPD